MIEPSYVDGIEETLYKPHYRPRTRDRSVERYEAMLAADWMDAPLRDLLETRIEELLQR